VFGDVYITLGNTLQEGRLSTSVFSQKPISLTVVEGDFGTLNQETSVERQGVGVDLDITTLYIGNKNTVRRSVVR
jgi:hypothetical protein